MNISKYLFHSLVLFFAGCSIEPVLPLPEGALSKIVVNGVLYDGQVPRIRVSRSYPLESESIDYRLENATVVVWEDDFPVDTLQFLPNLRYNTTTCELIPRVDEASRRLIDSEYVGDEVFEARLGALYHITVSAHDFETVVSDKIPFIRQLNGVNVDGEPNRCLINGGDFSLNRLGVDFKVERPLEGMVIIDIDLFRKGIIDFGTTVDLVDEGFAGDFSFENEIFTGFGCDEFFEMRVGIVVQPIGYVNFLMAQELQTDDLGGLFVRDGPVPTNILNGYGYFSVGESYNSFYLPR